MYTPRFKTFSTALNQDPSILAQEMTSYFAPLLVNILDLRFNTPYSIYSDILHVSVLFAESDLGLTIEAFYFQTDPATGQTAQESYNLSWQPSQCVVPLFFLDITSEDVAKSGIDRLLILGAKTNRATTAGAGLLGHQGSVYVAQPTAPIAPNGSGPATILNAWGTVVGTAINVFNADPVNLWPAGARAVVVFNTERISGGVLMGAPGCCGVGALTPAAPPTPPAPGPCIEKEVASVDPAFDESGINTPYPP